MVGAQLALGVLAEIEAPLTELNPRFGFFDGFGQPQGIFLGDLQQVKGDTLG